MIGLILAALYVAYAIVVNEVAPIAAVESTLDFLWWWHLAFASLSLICGLAVPVIGLVVTFLGDTAVEKGAGIAAISSTPIVLALCLMFPALFLGGVYAVDSGIEGGEIVNQTYVIVGAVLYGLGVIETRVNSSYGKKS